MIVAKKNHRLSWPGKAQQLKTLNRVNSLVLSTLSEQTNEY